MSSVFQEIGVTWKGQEYVVPPYKCMELAERVFHIIPATELGTGDNPATIARAFSFVLRFAGVDAKYTYTDSNGVARYDLDDEVYGELIRSEEQKGLMVGLLDTLNNILVPPEHLQQIMKTPEKPQATRKKKGSPGASSKKHTS